VVGLRSVADGAVLIDHKLHRGLCIILSDSTSRSGYVTGKRNSRRFDGQFVDAIIQAFVPECLESSSLSIVKPLPPVLFDVFEIIGRFHTGPREETFLRSPGAEDRCD